MPDSWEALAELLPQDAGGEASSNTRSRATEQDWAALDDVLPVYEPTILEKAAISTSRAVGELARAPELAGKFAERIGVPEGTIARHFPALRRMADWGRDIEDVANQAENPQFAAQDLGSQLARGAGSMLPFAAAGPLGGGALVALTGAAQTAVPMYEDVLAATGDEDKAWSAAAVGLGLGATEALGVGRTLSNLDRAAGGTLRKALLRVAAEGSEEALQEWVQTFGQATATQKLSGQEIRVLDNIAASGEAGFVGFLLGAGLKGSVEGAAAALDTTRTQEAPRPGEESGSQEDAPRGTSGVPEGALPPEPDRRSAPPGEATISGLKPIGTEPEAAQGDEQAPEAPAAPIGQEAAPAPPQAGQEAPAAPAVPEGQPEAPKGPTTEQEAAAAILSGQILPLETLQQFPRAVELAAIMRHTPGATAAAGQAGGVSPTSKEEGPVQTGPSGEASGVSSQAETSPWRDELELWGRQLGAPNAAVEAADRRIGSAPDQEATLDDIVQEWSAGKFDRREAPKLALTEKDVAAEHELRGLAEGMALAIQAQKGAESDPLTGLFNRRGDERWTKRVMSYARANGQKVARVFIDLADLTSLNNLFGHSFADKVIQAFVEEWRGLARATDVLAEHSSETVKGARVGGDEFTASLILPGHVTPDAIVERIERAAQKVLEQFGIQGDVAGRQFGADAGWAFIDLEKSPGEAIEAATEQADEMAKARKTKRAPSKAKLTAEDYALLRPKAEAQREANLRSMGGEPGPGAVGGADEADRPGNRPPETGQIAAVPGGEAPIQLAGGRSVPARYAVVSAEDLVPSHDARRGFRPNEGGDINERDYADPVEGRPFRETVERIASKPNARLLLSDTPAPSDGPPIVTAAGVVLGGNARSMAMQLIYSKEPDAEVLANPTIRAARRLGVTDRAVENIRHPVLVRIIQPGSEGTPGELSRALNEALTTAKGATTEAISRGRKIGPLEARDIAAIVGDATLREALSNPIRARGIVRAMAASGAFTEGDVTQLTNPQTGLPTQAGKEVIEDALLGAIIGDVRTLSETPPATRQALIRALPALVSIKGHWPGVVDVITHAAQGMAELRDSGQPLADVLRQATMPGIDVGWKSDEVAVGIVRALVEERLTKVAAMIDRAATAIADQARGQGNFFGGGRLPPRARLGKEFGVELEEGSILAEGDQSDIEDEESDGTVAMDPGGLVPEMGSSPASDPISGGAATPRVPIGGRLLGTLEQSPDPPKKGARVSQPQIIESLAAVVKAAGGRTPIRWGRMGRMEARGFFRVQPEIIRVKTANNVATAAHEVGHALEKHVFGWAKGGPWRRPRASKTMQEELVKLGRALYGDTKPAAGYKREGFAEFVRLYVTDHESVKRAAPSFSTWFDGEFRTEFPKVVKALRSTRGLVQRWGEQGSLERAKASMIDPAAWGQRWKKLAESLHWRSIKHAWIESGEALQELSRTAGDKIGGLAPSKDPFKLFKAFRLTHSARVRRMVTSGMIDLWGNKVGPALNEIRPLIRGRYEDFAIYLWAKRAQALYADPVKGPRNPGLSAEDADQVVAALQSDQFDLAASKVYEWSDGVLNYGAQASPTFRSVVDQVRAADPGNYIPLQREFDVLDSIWNEQRSRSGLSSGQGIVSRLKGSGRRIKDPLQSLIANAERTVLSAHRRAVLDATIKLSRIEGMGYVIEEVPRDKVPHSTDLEQAINAVRRKVRERTGLSVSLQTSGGADVDWASATDQLVGETLTFFAPAQFPKGQDPIIPVMVDGELKWYWVDHRLAATLAGLDVARLPKLIDMTLGMTNRAFRAGTTGLRAAFGLVTNPMRDVGTFFMNTRSRAPAAKLFARHIAEMTKAAVSTATGHRYESPYLKAFRDLGGEMAQPLGPDSKNVQRAARELTQMGGWRYLDPRNWFEFYRDLVQFPESASRTAELRNVAEQVGWKPGDPMSADQAVEMLIAAKEVTTDFSAAGALARVANQVMPFFNAAIQGTRSHVIAGRRNPGLFAWRGLEMTALTLALWYRNKDEEWWRQLDPEKKFLFWHIPFTWQGRREVVAIPRPFEVGGVFAALPEAMADAWYFQDPEAAKDAIGQFVEVVNPLELPPVVREALEQAANRDFFWDRPIVPASEERRPPAEQFNEWTTGTAIFLGRLFGKSPRRIDHAIRGLLGGAGADLFEALDLVGGNAKERGTSGELADAPVIGRLFRRGGAMGTSPRSVDQLFDARAEAMTKAASIVPSPDPWKEGASETQEERQRRLLLEDACEAISILSAVRSLTDDIDQRRELTLELVRLSKAAIAQAGESEVDRGPMKEAVRKARSRKALVEAR